MKLRAAIIASSEFVAAKPDKTTDRNGALALMVEAAPFQKVTCVLAFFFTRSTMMRGRGTGVANVVRSIPFGKGMDSGWKYLLHRTALDGTEKLRRV